MIPSSEYFYIAEYLEVFKKNHIIFYLKNEDALEVFEASPPGQTLLSKYDSPLLCNFDYTNFPLDFNKFEGI